MIVIDVQGFQHGQNMEFMCKEIAILNTDTKDFLHRFVAFPTSDAIFTDKIQIHLKWLTNNIHGLDWNCNNNRVNTLEYQNLAQCIRDCVPEGEVVAVKGLNKKQWLHKMITNEIIDVADEGSPNLDDLKNVFKSFHCRCHVINTLNCSLENVYLLHYWTMYFKKFTRV